MTRGLLSLLLLFQLGVTGQTGAPRGNPEGGISADLPGGGARGEELQLAGAFGSHMVLPADVRVPVRGAGPPGSEVEVLFGEQRRRARIADDGSFTVWLEPEAATGAPRALRVRCPDAPEVQLDDVVVGQVWLCAGQSNMGWSVAQSAESEATLARADRADLRLWQHTSRLHPGGRSYPIDELTSLTADNLFRTEGWARSDPERAAGFSAVAWHCGATLAEATAAPVGLIHVSVGGSPIEAWLPRGAFTGELAALRDGWLDNEDYPGWPRERARLNLKHALDAGHEDLAHPFAPAFLFEAGVAPLAGFPITGVLWYQGESNATTDGGRGAPVDPELNRLKLARLLSSWRAFFADPDLPIAMVQLPGMNRPWAPFREVQARVAEADPHTHLAVTIDLGHPTDVHPRRKQAVGERLARVILDPDGGRAPEVVQAAARSDGVVVLVLARAEGLRTTDGAAPRCFEVAGEDGVHLPAAAVLRDGRVLLTSPVEGPRHVRYAFSSDPNVNLVNGTGLPVAPFVRRLRE